MTMPHYIEQGIDGAWVAVSEHATFEEAFNAMLELKKINPPSDDQIIGMMAALFRGENVRGMLPNDYRVQFYKKAIIVSSGQLAPRPTEDD
jgi:hypothetical protein